jgi:hypothetical protein
MSDDEKPSKLNEFGNDNNNEETKLNNEETNLVPNILIFEKIKSYIKKDMEKHYPFTIIFSFVVGLIILILGILLSLNCNGEKVADNVTFQDNAIFDALIVIIGFIIISLSLYRLLIRKSIFGLNLNSLKDLDAVEEDVKTPENSKVEKTKDKNDIKKLDIPIIKKDITFKADKETNKLTDNKEANKLTDNKETNTKEDINNKNINN